MSPQLIELLFFAGVAFFIISKLISVLGTTSDDDATRKKSYFGEQSGFKDVTDTTTETSNNVILGNFPKTTKSSIDELAELINDENKPSILRGIGEIQDSMPSFNLLKFIKGAKAALPMILTAAIKNNDKELEDLVDKRYLEHIKNFASSYGSLTSALDNLHAKISDIYSFGNNIFIKILFTGKNIIDKIEYLNEEWTFSKNLTNPSPRWYLSNIDRPQ